MADSLDGVVCTAEDRKRLKELVYQRDLTKDELKRVIHRLDGILLKTADLSPENSFRLEIEFIRLCAIRKLDEIEQAKRRSIDRAHQYVQIVLNAFFAIVVVIVLFKLGFKS